MKVTAHYETSFVVFYIEILVIRPFISVPNAFVAFLNITISGNFTKIQFLFHLHTTHANLMSPNIIKHTLVTQYNYTKLSNVKRQFKCENLRFKRSFQRKNITYSKYKQFDHYKIQILFVLYLYIP